MDGHSGNSSWSVDVCLWSICMIFIFFFYLTVEISSPDACVKSILLTKFSGWTKSDCLTHVLLPLSSLQRFPFGQWCISVPFEVSWTESRTSPAINSVGKAGPTERMWGQRLHSGAHCGKKRPAWPIALLKPNHSQVSAPDTLVSLGERWKNRDRGKNECGFQENSEKYFKQSNSTF